MQVEIHARKLTIDPDLREAARAKVAHAARFFDTDQAADVEFSEEHNPRITADRNRVEITSGAAGQIIRVHGTGATAEAALDVAVDKFERQLRKLKDRLITRSRQAKDLPPPADDEDDEEDGIEIVRLKQFVLKPMTPEEAALQMDLLEHEFFFFQNAESDLPSVLYRRRDGAFGLIEPA